MPAPLPVPLREQMVHLHEQGYFLVDIAAQLGVRYSTLCRWWSRYRKEGTAGLRPHYERCGPHGPRDPALHALALAPKREHPTWGAGRIRVELRRQFPDRSLPPVRTLQRWFRAAGLTRLRPQPPPVTRERGREGHHVWEVDAKESMRLADGSGTCVLVAVDEASGALLEATPFSPVSLGPRATPGRPTGDARLVCTLGPAGAHPCR
jgi:transposase